MINSSLSRVFVLAAFVSGFAACTSSGGGGTGSGAAGLPSGGGAGGAGIGGGGTGSGGAALAGGGGSSGSGGTGGVGAQVGAGGAGGISSGVASAGGSGSGGTAGGRGGSAGAAAGGGASGGGARGGSGGAAGGVGGGGAGGAVDGGQPAVCAGLFCEDFESGAIDSNVWRLNQTGGQTVTVQKTTVGHGKYAAQFHALPNVLSSDFIITKNAPTALRGHHFGRAYVNVTPKPPDQHMVVLIAGTTGFPKSKYLEVGSIHNMWQLSTQSLLGVNSNGTALSGSAEAYSQPGGAIPLAQWFCMEWEFNDAPDQIRVFVNGAEDYAFTNISFNGVTTGQVGGFAEFAFGFYIWHAATYPFDMYYDDIVLDTKRVGCLP
jgi:hypothetical protein